MRKVKRHSVKRLILQLLAGAVVLTMGGAMLGGWLILRGSVAMSTMKSMATGIVVFAATLLSFYAAKKSPQKKGLWGIIAGGGFGLLLLLGNLLLFGQPYGNVVPTILGSVAAGVLGTLLGARRRKKYA